MATTRRRVPAYPNAEDGLESAVISTTECTGLVQAPPQDEEEADAYRDMYGIPVEESKGPADEN